MVQRVIMKQKLVFMENGAPIQEEEEIVLWDWDIWANSTRHEKKELIVAFANALLDDDLIDGFNEAFAELLESL